MRNSSTLDRHGFIPVRLFKRVRRFLHLSTGDFCPHLHPICIQPAFISFTIVRPKHRAIYVMVALVSPCGNIIWDNPLKVLPVLAPSILAIFRGYNIRKNNLSYDFVLNWNILSLLVVGCLS